MYATDTAPFDSVVLFGLGHGFSRDIICTSFIKINNICKNQKKKKKKRVGKIEPQQWEANDNCLGKLCELFAKKDPGNPF